MNPVSFKVGKREANTRFQKQPGSSWGAWTLDYTIGGEQCSGPKNLSSRLAAEEEFENEILRRGLHRRTRLIAWAIRAVQPKFLDLEMRTIRYLGNARSSEEFRAELDAYRSEYRNHGGLLRNTLGVRLSGSRLMLILNEVSPEAKE